MTTRFSELVWNENRDLIRAIHLLPFNIDLAAGTLSRQRFLHYIQQDSLYLARYSRALALCAAKAPSSDALEFFTGAATGAIAVEKSMHAGFLDRFDITPQAIASATMSPACQAYTDFLIAACYEHDFPAACAAILPCFWIYEDVGRAIAAQSAQDNPYRAWIDTYADDSFAAAVREAIRFTDEAYENAGDIERQAMHRLFERSTLYEYIFWDSAYALRQWPAPAPAPVDPISQ